MVAVGHVAQCAAVCACSAGRAWAGMASPCPGHHALCPSNAVTLGTRNTTEVPTIDEDELLTVLLDTALAIICLNQPAGH